MGWERNVVVKSKEELGLMREAGRVNALALQAVRQAIAPGISTAELDSIAENVILQTVANQSSKVTGTLSLPGHHHRQH